MSENMHSTRTFNGVDMPTYKDLRSNRGWQLLLMPSVTLVAQSECADSHHDVSCHIVMMAVGCFNYAMA